MNRIPRSLIAAMCMALGLAGVATAAKPVKNVISTNVFNLGIGVFSAEFEHMRNEKMGFYGVLRYGGYKIGSYETTFPGITLGLHMYPGGKGPEGMYWGPMLYANIVTTTFSYTTLAGTWPNWYYTTTEEEVSATFFGPMVDVGYRWNWGGFTLSPSFQVGFLIGNLEDSTGTLSLDYGGGAYLAGLNLGYAF